MKNSVLRIFLVTLAMLNTSLLNHAMAPDPCSDFSSEEPRSFMGSEVEEIVNSADKKRPTTPILDPTLTFQTREELYKYLIDNHPTIINHIIAKPKVSAASSTTALSIGEEDSVLVASCDKTKPNIPAQISEENLAGSPVGTRFRPDTTKKSSPLFHPRLNTLFQLKEADDLLLFMHALAGGLKANKRQKVDEQEENTL